MYDPKRFKKKTKSIKSLFHGLYMMILINTNNKVKKKHAI